MASQLEDLYINGMERDPAYVQAKRKLVTQTADKFTITPHCTDDAVSLLERIEVGDFDDNEVALGVSISSESADDVDWWMEDFSLRLAMICADQRRRRHPELPLSSLYIDQPELTHTFHRLAPHERITIATTVLAQSVYHMRNEHSEIAEPVVRLLTKAMQQAYEDVLANSHRKTGSLGTTIF